MDTLSIQRQKIPLPFNVAFRKYYKLKDSSTHLFVMNAVSSILSSLSWISSVSIECFAEKMCILRRAASPEDPLMAQ